jgi:hypothetical protein
MDACVVGAYGFVCVFVYVSALRRESISVKKDVRRRRFVMQVSWFMANLTKQAHMAPNVARLVADWPSVSSA